MMSNRARFPRTLLTMTAVPVWLVLALLSGCGEKSVSTITPPPAAAGNVVINAEPDSLNAPWRLVGPDDLTITGRGDSTLTGVVTGDYVLTWESLPEWNTPFSRRLMLETGGEIRFDGIYTNGDPFFGLGFGTDSTLEVATWNIEHFPKNNAVTVELVARAIMTLDIDILALQEIESRASFEDLDEKLSSWTGVRANSSSYDINLAFLYRNNGDWTVDSVHEIFTDHAREFPRAPLVMEGKFKGLPVVVINNHFKCCGDNTLSGDPWDEEVRRRDASALLHDHVGTRYAGRKVIVVGDLNDSLTDDPASNVFNVFLDDDTAWRFVDLPIAAGPSSSWSFPGWPSHLDHILITEPLFAGAEGPSAAVVTIPLSQGFPGGFREYDRNMSDHLPVALKLVP